MADIGKVNNIAAASIAKVNNVAKASISKVDGTDMPSSGVTASDVLVHWWKMNDGATTAADYGTATGTGTAVTHVGASSVSGGGPSAIGSPDCISYDGSNDHSWVKLRDTTVGSETTVGSNTTADETWTMAFWMKDTGTPNSNFKTWIGAFSGGSWNDGFIFWHYGEAHLAADHFNIRTGQITLTDVTDSDWHHYILEFNNPSPSGTTAAPSSLFSLTQDNATALGHSLGSYLGTSLTSSSVREVRLSFGGMTSNSVTGSSAYNTLCSMSDIRVYSRVLTSGEKAAIVAGDW